jgi:hypothetical protein
MEVQPDFKELLELFNAHHVEYVIIGAFALAHYGAPRTTGDIDLLVRPDPANAQRIVDALKEFGFDSMGFTAKDFSAPDNVIQLGVAPVRIDIVNSITGVSWDEVERGRLPGLFGDVPAYYLGKAEFVANKRAVGRLKDLGDLEALGEQG